MWASLAESCGLALVAARSPAELHHLRDAVGVVAAGGAEERLESVFLEMAPSGGEVAAVGALANHHPAAAVVRAGAAELFALPQGAALLRSWLSERAGRLRSAQSRNALVGHEASKSRFEGILGES